MSAECRMGQGYDIHRLVEGRRLMLGGVEIPHSSGLMGHSDGDVLLHAIIDALLGAAGLGDIGEHFPDNDAAFKDADSARLLHRVTETLKGAGWRPRQIDCTIVAERPRLGPAKAKIRDRIAELLAMPPADVNVKAKTAEGLGPVGNGDAIEAQALAVIERIKKD